MLLHYRFFAATHTSATGGPCYRPGSARLANGGNMANVEELHVKVRRERDMGRLADGLSQYFTPNVGIASKPIGWGWGGIRGEGPKL